MKKTAIIPLILGLGIGLFAVKLAVDTIRKAQAASSAARVIQVVQAAQDIDANTEITPEMVKLIETADNSLAPQHERLEQLDLAIGRVTAKSIPANVPVLASMLAPAGTPPGLLGRIKPGYRAVSIRIDEVSGVAYQIKPGDWVDVVVVMDVDTGLRGKKETIAKVILEHVQVAAIGHDTSGPQPSNSGTKVKPAKSATLLVEEAEVPKIHLAGTRGKLTLAMRGENDLPTAGSSAVAAFDDTTLGFRPSYNLNVGPEATPFWMKVAGGMFGANDDDDSKPKSKSKAVQKLVPVDPELVPRTVMVIRSNSGKGGARVIERVTFAGLNSPTVLEMRGGAPTGAGVMMGSQNTSGGTATSSEMDQ